MSQQLGITTVILTRNPAIAEMADRVLSMQTGQIIPVQQNRQKLTPDNCSGSDALELSL